MAPTDFATFAPYIQAASRTGIEEDSSLDGALCMLKAGSLQVDYAPFDHINSGAKLVLVGLTPGRQQARNSLIEANRQLAMGSSLEVSAHTAKQTASFSGPMRANLVALLNSVGIATLLGLSSTHELFDNRPDLVHFTSALRYPVYINGKNWSGAPAALKTPALLAMVEKLLLREVEQFPTAVFVPLGSKATEILLWCFRALGKSPGNVLEGLPHPSGANAERISYFLGKKDRANLSAKTDGEAIDTARMLLKEKMAALLAA